MEPSKQDILDRLEKLASVLAEAEEYCKDKEIDSLSMTNLGDQLKNLSIGDLSNLARILKKTDNIDWSFIENQLKTK